jgi:hypothetical protein
MELLNANYTVDTTSPVNFYLWGAHMPIGNNTADCGMWAKVGVVNPPGFTDLGLYNWTQLSTASIHVFMNDNGEWHNREFGHEGLDSQFPMVPSNRSGWDALAGPNSSLPTSDGWVVDAPGIDGLVNINHGTTVYSFRLYVMYRPPGTDSTFVPLRLYPGSCDGTFQRGTPWTYSGSQSAPTGFTEFPPHPQWTRLAQDDPWVSGPP